MYTFQHKATAGSALGYLAAHHHLARQGLWCRAFARAFGNYAVRLVDPCKFHLEVSGTRANYAVADLDGQLRGVLLQHLQRCRKSGIPFLDLAVGRVAFCQALSEAVAPYFEALGVALET